MICWARLSRWMPSRVNTCTSMTVPSDALVGTRSDVSFTSEAFSPKIARSSFSSGVSVVSPFGVTLPTSVSPGLHFGADVDDAGLVQAASCFSARFGMSRVISSAPSLVSRAITDQFLDVDRGVAVVGDDAFARSGSSPRSCSRSTA